MNNSKVNGFAVIVHQGREITEAQYAALSVEDQNKCKKHINGPHHEAKWARHLKYNNRPLQEKFSQPFGNHESLHETYNLKAV